MTDRKLQVTLDSSILWELVMLVKSLNGRRAAPSLEENLARRSATEKQQPHHLAIMSLLTISLLIIRFGIAPSLVFEKEWVVKDGRCNIFFFDICE